jgi:hypothetical protein
MTFAQFLEIYYLPQQRAEIMVLLNDLCIYDGIEPVMDDFYNAVSSNNKSEIATCLAAAASTFLILVHEPLRCMQPGEHKNRVKRHFATLAAYLARHACQLSGLGLLACFDLLLQATRETYSKKGLDLSVLEELSGFDCMQKTASVQEQKPSFDSAAFSKPVRLEWQSEKPLDFFADDLVKIFKVAKKQLYLLFDTIKTEFKIELPSKYLSPFLCLFCQLHQSGVVKVHGNRGLYVYLRQHLRAPVQDSYPKRDFRKLRHEAEQNETEKNNISRIIKPLLDKYCVKKAWDDNRTMGF